MTSRNAFDGQLKDIMALYLDGATYSAIAAALVNPNKRGLNLRQLKRLAATP